MAVELDLQGSGLPEYKVFFIEDTQDDTQIRSIWNIVTCALVY